MRTRGIGWSVVALGLVAAGGLRGEELPLRFADDFSKDTRQDYDIKGDVAWQKGRLALGKDAAVGRSVELGHRAEVRASVRRLEGHEEGEVFLVVGGGTSIAILGLHWAGEKVSLVKPTQPPEVLALPGAGDEWEMCLEVHYGLMQAKAWPRGQPEPKDWQLVRLLGKMAWQPERVAVMAFAKGSRLGRWQVRGAAALRWTEEQHRQLAQAERLAHEVVRLHEQGKAGEAEPKARECLELSRKVLPPGHPDLASDLVNLSGILHGLGKHAEARPPLEEAVGINRKVLPPAHPNLAGSLNNLGRLLLDMGQPAEARPLLEEALEIRRKALLPGHPDLVSSLNPLGALLQLMGKNTEARPLQEEALAIQRKALPPGNPAWPQASITWAGYSWTWVCTRRHARFWRRR
jgi:hypothetical protein